MSVTFKNGSYPLVSTRFVPPLEPGAIPESKSRVMQSLGHRIVAALARAGWDVPGLDVGFRTFGSGTNVTRHVDHVRGTTATGPFRLDFSMGQSGMGGVPTPSIGLFRVSLPSRMSVRFPGHDAFPDVVLYVGTDWTDAGGEEFARYHPYSDSIRSDRATVSFRYRNGFLRPDVDSIEGLPTILSFDGVMTEVHEFVTGLCASVEALPAVAGHDDVTDEGDANLRRLAAVERTPVPEGFPTLYSWVPASAAARIVSPSARRDGGSQDYVLSGNGYRCVPFGADSSGTLPERTHDGFDYASDNLAVRGEHCVYIGRDDDLPVAVKLSCLNEIYVVDNAAFDVATAATFERVKASGRERMSDRELDACIAAVGLTFVAASDYDGSFAEPVYLIGRQIGPDEGRLMTGRVVQELVGDGVRVTMYDRDGGVVLFERDNAYESDLRTAKRIVDTVKGLGAIGSTSRVSLIPVQLVEEYERRMGFPSATASS